MARSSSMLAGWLLSTASLVLAHEVDTRHGVIAERPGVAVEGGLTFTWQGGDDSRARDELLASFDLSATLPLGSGELVAYFEGNVTPREQGVSSRFAEANADAGSALDGNGRGRLQLSELHYRLPLASSTFYLGLLDPARFLDASDIANDETRQFISADLVNDPSIALPDYTIGLAWHDNSDPARADMTLFVSSSNGLADNPDASYRELLDLGADGKGLFTAAEFYLPHGDGIWRIGAWLNSAPHARFDASGERIASGLYASIDGRFGATHWNLRLGLADPRVVEAARFIGIALSRSVGAADAWGLGWTHTGLSPHARDAGFGDIEHGEFWWRHGFESQLTLSASLQWLRNSGFETANGEVWVTTLRATWSF